MLASACAFDSSGFPGFDTREASSSPSETVTTIGATTGTSSSSTGGEGTSTDTGSTTSMPTETSAPASSSESSESGTTGDPPALGPFLPPEAIEPLNSPSNEDDPTVRLDYAEIYFASDRPGGYGLEDIWRATRPDAGSPWGLPVVASELCSAYNDGGPELSGDGLTIVLNSDRLGGAGSFDLYVAIRTTTAVPWQPPLRITELATPASEVVPTLSPDLLEMFYCAPDLSAVVQRTTRPALAMPWIAGTLVVELDDPNADDCAPFLMTDGVRLAFSSSRMGGVGAGDLWFSSRKGGVFAPPEPIEGVNDLAYEDDPWIAPDGALIVFASNRGDGDYDLWAAEAAD